MYRIYFFSILLTFGMISACGHTAEHAGKKAEHAGQTAEHAGEKTGHSRKKTKGFTAADIKKAIHNHIDQKTQNGVYTMTDRKKNEELKLEFVKIHDPVRKITKGKHKGKYFACTDFHVTKNASKVYDLDFWLEPASGKLSVVKSKVHKEPVRKNGTWEKKARYTFKNDEIVNVQ